MTVSISDLAHIMQTVHILSYFIDMENRYGSDLSHFRGGHPFRPLRVKLNKLLFTMQRCLYFLQIMVCGVKDRQEHMFVNASSTAEW